MAEELLGGTELYSAEFRKRQDQMRQRSENALRRAEELQRRGRELRVVIADDQDLVRNGFRLILSSFPNLKVVGEARDGYEAVQRARELHPDVVLMDIRMSRMNGIEATAAITADPSLSDTRVLIFTTFDVDEYVYDALQAGAGGFMLKDSDPEDIATAISVVAEGDALIQPSITRRLVEAFVETRARIACIDEPLQVLTEREREILEHVARGLTNDEIAETLVISPATVKTHVARVMSKLEAHDRAQLVVIAYECGLVVAGS